METVIRGQSEILKSVKFDYLTSTGIQIKYETQLSKERWFSR